MAECDPLVTQHDIVGDVAGELAAVGFAEAEEIGRGGFGVVYRCSQPSLDRTVAVKVLTADLDDENLERFMREQRAMGRLSGHPNIVNILEIGATTSGRPFIVMQYHPPRLARCTDSQAWSAWLGRRIAARRQGRRGIGDGAPRRHPPS